MMMKKNAKRFTVVLVICAMLMSMISTTLVSAEEANLPEAIGEEVTSVETVETEGPAAEEPAVEEPAVEEPVVNDPVVDEPVVNDPVVDEPVVNEPVVDEPVVDEPVVNEPVVDEPVVDEPVVDEPVVNEPVVDEPVVSEPVVNEPVVEEPVVEEPVVEEPVVNEPAVEETEDEEAEDEETVEFSCELTAKLENEGDIIEGQQIVLNATVLNANMEFSFKWQRTPMERNEDEEEIWTDISNVLTYTFDATEEADDYFYRATVTAEDGTVICSDRISFDVLPAEEIIAGEPETEETGDDESADVEITAEEEPAAEEPAAEESAPRIPVMEDPEDEGKDYTWMFTGDNAAIYANPTADEENRIYVMQGGELIKVREFDGDWYKIKNSGYIMKSDVCAEMKQETAEVQTTLETVTETETAAAGASEEELADEQSSEEGLVSFEDYETPLGIPGQEAAPIYAYERDENGNLVLDEKGNPTAIRESEEDDIPVAFLRDENGELVLDKDGNPIVTQTVPADAEIINTLEDALNPERKIDIYYSWNNEKPAIGGDVTFIAVLYGYDNLEYTVQWQQSKDNVNWSDISEANEVEHLTTITRDNYRDFWRVQVTITSIAD